MIIHQPKIITQHDHAIVGAKVELAASNIQFPEFLWYRVPIQYQEYLTLQNDAFLVPALLAGMFYGEDIEVRGVVSPQLAYQLEEYQHILSLRFPKYLRSINISYEKLKPLVSTKNAVGSTFTGGVDSIFTLWKHLPPNQSEIDFQITHTIFVKGFDILPTEEEKYWHLFNRFESQLAKVGVEIIPLETNIISIPHSRLPLSYLFGPSIVGSSLSLAGLFKRFYIPSSWDHHMLMTNPQSSDPLVDGLLSTDTLRIVHHGATHRRIEKVEEIVDWELAQNSLWVCIKDGFRKNAWNCSRCEKCMRTMIPLYALGKLGNYKTFEKPLKNDYEGLWWARKFSLRHNFVSEVFPFVKKHRRNFLPWLRVAAFFGLIRYGILNYMPGFAKNMFRKYGYFSNLNDAPDSYEIPSITKLFRNINDS